MFVRIIKLIFERNEMEMETNKKNKDLLSSLVQKIMKNMMHTDLDKKFRMDVLEKTRDRIVPNKIISILNTSEDDFIKLYETDIYWLAKYIQTNADKYGYYGYISADFDDTIDVNKYFTSEEKFSAESFVLVKEDIKKSFKLENVRKLSDDMWICDIFPYGKAKEGLDSAFLKYNFDTQREAQVSNIGIDIVKTPTIYNENIAEMKELMKDKSFESNMVTVNILETGEEEFFFNKDTGVMEFFTPVNIVDGYHRIEASRQAVNEKPAVSDQFLILKIVHYNAQKAQRRVVLQESKGSRISTVKQKSLEPKESIQVVKRLNEEGSRKINVMFDMISDNLDEVFKVENKYCLVTAISEVIDETYGSYLDKPSDISKISAYLLDFFNEIASNFERDFFEMSINESRDQSSILHNNMFSLLTYVAKKIYKQSNWRSILEQFIINHNFDISNVIWKDELNIKATKYTKKNRSAMYSWVDNQIDELLNDSEIAVTK
jgi:hypothetical protein